MTAGPKHAGDLSQYDTMSIQYTFCVRRIELAINYRPTSLNIKSLRSFGAVFLLVVYLIGGPLHGACGMAFRGADPGVSCQTSDQSHNSESAVLSHHCHGCFAGVIPVPCASAIGETIGYGLKWTAISIDGLSPTLNTPPPKPLA